MLTVFLGFFRSALADLSLSLKRNQPARVLSDFVNVSAVVRASIACF